MKELPPEIEPPRRSNFPSRSPQTAEAWQRLALQNNPLLRAAINRSRLAKKEIRVQFAGHLPQIDLVGQSTFSTSERSTGIEREQHSIRFQLKVPIFAGGGVASRVREARKNYTATLAEEDRIRRQILRETATALNDLLAAREQVKGP